MELLNLKNGLKINNGFLFADIIYDHLCLNKIKNA